MISAMHMRPTVRTIPSAAAPVHPPAAPSPARAAGRRFASPRFYVCLALLVSSAIGLPVLARLTGAYFRKKPVPLKTHLAALKLAELEPDYRPHKIQAPPLNDESVQSLGTDEYLQVRLIDTRRTSNDPARVASVFITYYTGKPDMVPHVPDECYLAGGYDRAGWPQSIEVPVPAIGAPNDRVPVRLSQFQSRGGQDRPTVLYFFHCNGEYAATRDGVRLLLANPFTRYAYAYYAKIEVTFSGEGSGVRAGKNESIQAMAPLLQKLMPVLLADHFAWDRVVSGEIDAGQR